MGIVLGASFGGIVTSLVNDVMMPPIGLVLGRVDFSNLFINLTRLHFETVAAAKVAGGCDAQLRHLFERRYRFCDCVLCNVPAGTAGE